MQELPWDRRLIGLYGVVLVCTGSHNYLGWCLELNQCKGGEETLSTLPTIWGSQSEQSFERRTLLIFGLTALSLLQFN